MAVTSPDNIRTPDSGDQYALVQDLGVLADSTQAAITKRANLYVGTAAQRTAFTTATNGMNWQDTDSITMIWKRVGAAWVPAVWGWSGTTAQRDAFSSSAPAGFTWFSTTDNTAYVRVGGSWVVQNPDPAWTTVMTPGPAGSLLSQYRKFEGYVEMRGVGTKPAGTSLMFSLPVGYRPFQTFNFFDPATPGASPPITITAAGAVNHSNTAAAWVSLDSVRFGV